MYVILLFVILSYVLLFLFRTVLFIDIESLKNRLLKVVICQLLAQVLIDFFSFLFAAAVNSTNEANKAGSMCH